MAAGDPVQPNQHVARYCKASQVDKGRATGTAFLLEGTHTELSVSWLECLHPHGNRAAQLRAVLAALRGSKFKPKANAFLAVLQVEQFIRPMEIGAALVRLAVRHDPVAGNDGHCGVYDMPSIDSPLAAAVGLELASRITEPIARVGDLDTAS